MYSTLSARSLLLPGVGDAVQRRQATGSATVGTEDALRVESTDLLKGHKTVEIKHNGLVYRLQTTKLGKLILTK